jgi:hypothetical protein
MVLRVNRKWNEDLQEILMRHSAEMRPELVTGLDNVLKYKVPEVERLARKIVKPLIVNFRPQDHNGILALAFTGRKIVPFYAAVYQANADYYDSKLDIDNEHTTINLPVADGQPASYDSKYGEKKHLVTIPTWKFSSWKELLASMDAESRHAVHNNFLHTHGLEKNNRAWRAYLVLSEVVDEGEIFTDVPDITPHYDPFLEELDLFDGEDGHNGAKYYCKHLLSNDPIKKRQQLNWLIRLKLREKDTFASVLKLNEVKERFSWIIRRWDSKDTPYLRNLDPLTKFYTTMGVWDGGDTQVTYCNFARKKLLEHFPFVPETAEIINVEGTPTVVYASILDYVALKLKYTSPSQLAREIKVVTK